MKSTDHPAHRFARAYCFKPSGRACQPGADPLTRTSYCNFAHCFSSPRYRVLQKRSCFLTTPNTCSTFRTHRRLCVFRFLCVVLAAPAQLLDLRRAAIDLVFDFPGQICFGRPHLPAFGRQDTRCHRKRNLPRLSAEMRSVTHHEHWRRSPLLYEPGHCPCLHQYALCSQSARCCLS